MVIAPLLPIDDLQVEDAALNEPLARTATLQQVVNEASSWLVLYRPAARPPTYQTP